MYSLFFGRPPQPVERRSERRPVCLVVEDDAVCRAMVQRQLRMLGLEAIAASSSRDALILMRRRRPTMVLIDGGLPDGDGYGLARRIRRLEQRDHRLPDHQRARLVGLSAHAGPTHQRLCLSAGMDAALAKPASLPALAAALGIQTVETCGTPNAGATSALHQVYRSSCLRDLMALKAALKIQDGARARRYAHRIRGASQMVGAHVIAGMAAVLERSDAGRAANTEVQLHALRWMDSLLRPVPYRSERIA